MLSVLGIGLSKTGTTSLGEACRILGLRCLDYDTVNLTEILAGRETSPDFSMYDDVDAVTDIPAAFFYEELLEAYPECKAVLTVRDPDSWFRSVVSHYNERFPLRRPGRRHRVLARLGARSAQSRLRYHEFRTNMRNLVFGSISASEFLYKKRFAQHNRMAQAIIAPERLLVMNITAGDGWEALCPFLGLPVPNTPFPFRNKTDYENNTHHQHWPAASDGA